MGAWIVSAGLFAALLGQSEPDATATKEAIADAVAALGSPQFSARRRASQFLWEQGLAAEPALKQATESADREVRLRVQRILNDFQYGILPGVPVDIVAMIRQFRDAPPDQQLPALQRLADRDRFDEIQRLIRLEPDAQLRRQLLVYLMQIPRAVERFDPDRLEQLIASVGADCDVTWRRTVLAQLLFSQPVIQQLADKGRLDVLAKIVDREASADVRRQMLAMLFQNAAAVTSLVENDQMPFVLKVIAKEPDQKTRGAWIGQLLAMSGVIQKLADDGGLEDLLKFAQENVAAEQRGEIIQQVFRSSSVVKAILEKNGIDRLISLAAAEKEPGERGRLLATLVSSAAVREHLTESGQNEFALKLAAREKDPTTRNEYMNALMTSAIGYSLARNEESRKVLWESIKSDESGKKDQATDWRSVAILRIFMYGSDSLLKKDGEAEWILSFLRDELTPEGRTQILERLVTDYRLKNIMLQEKHFDAVLALTRELPTSHRGKLLASMFGSSDPFQNGKDYDRVKLMVTLAREETDTECRRQYLRGLFQNTTAMSALVKGEYFDELWKLVGEEKDPVEHAILRGCFLRCSEVVQVFIDRDQLSTLVQFAQETDNADAREEYVKQLFLGSQAMTSLIDAGHYDALFALANGENDESSRVYLLSQFYSNAKVIEQLTKEKKTGELLEFAEEHADDKRIVSFLQRVFFNQQAVAALVEEGRTDTMLEIVRQHKDRYLRDSLLRTIFGSGQVVKYFAKNNRLEEMFELIAKENPDSRYQIYYNMIIRSEAVTVLVEHEWLEQLLELVKLEEKPDKRGQLLGRLIVQSNVLDYLVDHEQLDLIFQLAREQTDERARHPYLEALFSSSTAIGVLLDKGHFDALYKLASNNSDPGQRIQHRARLLTNSKAVEYLVAEGRIELLLQMVTQQTDQPLRRSMVSHIVNSQSAVAALVEHGKFEPLVALCRSVSDAVSRRRILGELLMSGKVVEQLAKTGTLDETVQDVLQEADENTRKQYYQRLLSRSDAVDALVEHGQFDVLYKAAEAEPNETLRKQHLGQLVTAPNVMKYLGAKGKMELVLKIVSEQTDRSRQTQYLTNIVYKPEAMKALLDGGCFDQMIELISGQQDDSQRRSLMATLLFNTVTLEYLAEKGQVDRLRKELARSDDPNLSRQFVQQLLYNDAGRRLLGSARLGDELVALLESDPEEQNRQSYARQVVTNEQIWQALIGSGQVEIIYKVAEWVPDEPLRRTSLQRMLYAPSGLIPYHVQRGEFEEVTRLLEEHADDDLGRLRLATYLLATGQIDQRIAELRRQLQERTPATLGEASATATAAQAASLHPGERTLTYLLRVKGDLSEAIRTAELTEDSGLLRGLLIEARRWSEAAELQASGPCPLPIPTSYQTTEMESHRRVEQLSLVAAYHRLAGGTGACDQAIAEIQQLAASEPTDAKLAWFCVEALLLNDRVEEGISLAAKTHPCRALDLYAYRHQYREALELAQWPEDGAPDSQWLESLPVNGGSTSPSPDALLELPLKVARILHTLGRRDEAERVLTLVDDYSEQQEDSSRSSSTPRRQCWEQLCAALFDMGHYERAWELAARTMLSPGSSPNILSRLYSRRYNEALGWWQFFRERHESEPAAAVFGHVHAALNPQPDEDAEQFAALVAEAIERAQSKTDSWRKMMLIAFARTCMYRGEIQLALRCLEPVTDELQPDERLLQADALRQNEQWPEAAEAYHAAWEEDKARLSALYLAGEALERAGRTDEGRTHKEQALLMALDSRARLTLATEMMRFGLRDAGLAQLQLVLRTAPIEHPEWNEAARQLGNALQQEDPAEASDMLEYSLLDDLRTAFFLLNTTDHLRTPSRIHHLRATTAVRIGQFEQAKRHIQMALAASPGDTDLPEELVPQLEWAGQNDMANSLFRQSYQAYGQWNQAYPESGLLNNDYAWLMARCGRHLDQAMVHAKKAVEIAPDNGSYLDTLAEVYFQQGDRESAVDLSRRAVHLRPDSETLRAQLDRFQNDALPSS